MHVLEKITLHLLHKITINQNYADTLYDKQTHWYWAGRLRVIQQNINRTHNAREQNLITLPQPFSNTSCLFPDGPYLNEFEWAGHHGDEHVEKHDNGAEVVHAEDPVADRLRELVAERLNLDRLRLAPTEQRPEHCPECDVRAETRQEGIEIATR